MACDWSQQNFMLQFLSPPSDVDDIVEVGRWMQQADHIPDDRVKPISPEEVKLCTNRRLSMRITTDVHIKFVFKLIWYWQRRYEVFFTITPDMVLYVVEHLVGSLKWLKDNVGKANRPLHDSSINRTSEVVGSIYLRMVHRVMIRILWFGPIGLPPLKTSFRLFDYRKGKSFVCKVYNSPMAKLMQLDIKTHKAVFDRINKRAPIVKVLNEVKNWFYSDP